VRKEVFAESVEARVPVVPGGKNGPERVEGSSSVNAWTPLRKAATPPPMAVRWSGSGVKKEL
jgi:hypothetical protein